MRAAEALAAGATLVSVILTGKYRHTLSATVLSCRRENSGPVVPVLERVEEDER